MEGDVENEMRSPTIADTQALMPLRVAVSVGAAPGFARLVFRPLQRMVARMRTRPVVAGRATVAGTATGGTAASGQAKP